MNIVVTKTNLKKGLATVEKSSGESLNLPILKNTLIEVQDNKIKLVSTNLEIAITFFVPGKIIENGKTTVPISILLNLINNFQSEKINLETKNNNLIIKSDNYKATINGISAEEFPIIPKVKNTNNFIEIKADTFKKSLSQVIIATQFSDIRPELNGILFDFSLDNLKLVATDSFRLAEKTLSENNFKSNYEESFKTIIPLKTAQELLKILEDDEILRIYYDETQILFKTEQLELISRVLEGNFPDYGAIVPKNFLIEISLEKEEFANALKLSSVFSGRNNEIKIVISEEKSLDIVSSDPIVGENCYSLSAKIQGKIKKREVFFNWKYLVDVLKVIDEEKVFFGINEDNEVSLIKPMEDKSYFYILKPIIKE